MEGSLTTIFSRLHNSEQYWVHPRNDLNCMVFHYGPATWFLTLSPGEWLWEDFGAYLRELNPAMHDLSISALVVADPISASRFIDNKFKAVLDFLLFDKVPAERCPLGNVIHYYVRHEYQSRGVQHFHLQIWVEDAPLMDDGVTNEEEISAFIAKYATCQLLDPTLCPTLYERVMKFQHHKCNDYCLRSKETKTGFRKACRFGFPRPQCEKVHLRSVVEAVAGRKCLKTSHSVQVFDDITYTKSLASRLWNVALRSLSHRECCRAMEAADTLLGISLFSTDAKTTIRWVDVNMVRSRKLKDRATIEALDGESSGTFSPSWVDTYYPNRPVEIEGMHLYEFLAWHDWEQTQSSESFTYYPFMGGFFKKRSQPYLLNHYKYSVSEEPEKYYYSFLLLLETESLIGISGTYAEAFHAVNLSMLYITIIACSNVNMMTRL